MTSFEGKIRPERGERKALLNPETIAEVRQTLMRELENLYSDPGFPTKEEDFKALNALSQGEKIETNRILLDKIARIVGDLRIAYTIEELRQLYDQLTIGWQQKVEPIET